MDGWSWMDGYIINGVSHYLLLNWHNCPCFWQISLWLLQCKGNFVFVEEFTLCIWVDSNLCNWISCSAPAVLCRFTFNLFCARFFFFDCMLLCFGLVDGSVTVELFSGLFIWKYGLVCFEYHMCMWLYDAWQPTVTVTVSSVCASESFWTYLVFLCHCVVFCAPDEDSLQKVSPYSCVHCRLPQLTTESRTQNPSL